MVGPIPNFYLDENSRSYFNAAIHFSHDLVGRGSPDPRKVEFCKRYFEDFLLILRDGVNPYPNITRRTYRCEFDPPRFDTASDEYRLVVETVNAVLVALGRMGRGEDFDGDEFVENLERILAPVA